MKKSKAGRYIGVFAMFLFLIIGFAIYSFKDSKEDIKKYNNGIKENHNKPSYSNEVKEDYSKPSYNPIDEETVDTKGSLIRVFKKNRLLKLYVDGQLIHEFKVGLGSAPIGNKNKEGDRKTPVGKYYICTRNDKSRFTLFLGLSYPNIEDAKRGLENRLIDEETFNKIKIANERKVQPPWKTPLGGAVGIHGSGNSSDWTWGCVALSDEDIRTLWKYAKMKTPVEIYE